MRYFVIASDGQRYGPADIPTLNQWIADGRLTADMMLEGENGGRMVASSVPGLMFGQPPQMNSPYGGTVYQGAGAGRGMAFDPSAFPKFNWGAFFWTWIWGLNHKKPITLVVLLVGLILGGIDAATRVGGSNPMQAGVSVLGGISWLINLGMMIWIGINGYQWAWESGRFASYEDCRKCQTIWGWWALGFAILCCGCYGVMIAMAVGAMSTMG
ncbi:MAG TPA: hypothetical protein PKA27_04455 [Fimbriimonadaceae bacterium]|nr:hypothetical protein [Fimbriimonadaceae bacterium]